MQKDSIKRSQSFRKGTERSRTLDEIKNLESALVKDVVCQSKDKMDSNSLASVANDSLQQQERYENEQNTSKAIPASCDSVECAVECVAEVNEYCVDVVQCVSEVVQNDINYSNVHQQENEYSTEEYMVECVSKESEEIVFQEPVAVCAAQDWESADEPCMMVSCSDNVEPDDDVCMVECEFEVVSVEQCDDVQSTTSGDHVRTEEVVMEAEERIVEQLPQSPHEKALLKRR
mgnify:CR=1 FL=1